MQKITIVDTAYYENLAFTAGALISNWNASSPEKTFSTFTTTSAEYVPGQFYKRELPCILHFLKEVSWGSNVIVIDGYVSLSDSKRGLGMYLYKALDMQIPVIGVAKNVFTQNTTSLPIFRGTSKKPLYITAAGIELQKAAEDIQNMFGEHRIPTILKIVDSLSKSSKVGQ